MILFPFLVVGMFGAFASSLFKDFTNNIAGNDTVIMMMVVFGAFFFGSIGYMIWLASIDLKRGFKYRVAGIVTDKRLNVTTSSTTAKTNSRRAGGNSTRTTRHYYLYINNEEYFVQYKEYTKARVGSHVVLDKAPKSNLSLKLDVIEPAGVDYELEKERKTSNKKFLESTIQEVRFRSEDYDALKKIFNAEKKRRFMFIAPLLFFNFSLLISGFWAILLFLFPLILIPLYQIFRLTRSYARYRNNKLYGHKVGVTNLVKDKLTFTSNRLGSANRIRTTLGTMNVDTLLYDKLSVGDKLHRFHFERR